MRDFHLILDKYFDTLFLKKINGQIDKTKCEANFRINISILIFNYLKHKQTFYDTTKKTICFYSQFKLKRNSLVSAEFKKTHRKILKVF